MGKVHHTRIREEATKLASTLIIPWGYPQKDRVWPTALVIQILNKCNWPIQHIEALIPQREHRGVRAGQHTGKAIQKIAVVPKEWLEILVSNLGGEYEDFIRAEVPDEE